jgi:hypothetical protein
MGSGGIRRLAISVRERSSEGTNRTRRQLNPGVYHPGQVQPSEGSLAPRAGQTQPFPDPTIRGDGLAHSSDADVQCPP